jgi:hypothetical protein
MKLIPTSIWRNRLALLLLAGLLATSGCAGLQRRPPATLEQIVEMSRGGMAPEAIVAELRETRTVHALSGAQIAKLHEDGVPDAVLDYLQQAYIDHVRWQERSHLDDRYWHGPCVGCYYYRPWVAPYFIYPH